MKTISSLVSLIVIFGMFILFGCSGGSGDSGSSGGSSSSSSSTTLATSTDAGHTVTLIGSTDALPNGLSASDIKLTTKAPADVPAAPVEASLLLAVECEPTGISFSQPVTLTFKLSPARTAGELLTVYLVNAGAWTATGINATVGADGLSASATITHFSTYGLFAPVNAALPGDKFFTFASGVNDGGSPSEIMYDDVNGRLLLPHSSALSVAQPYANVIQAPYGIYRDSNGSTPPDFPATVGSVYVLRSTMSTLQYFKLQIISATIRNGSTYGVVTFKYEQILPQDVVNVVGQWKFPDNSCLGVPNAVTMDYTAPNSDFYAMGGDYTNKTTLVGTFTTWPPPSGIAVTGKVTITLSLATNGTLNATLTGDAPLGTVTLTGGVKQ
ncbi:MAG: hypothetical protein ABFD82_08375 [Syntrophaceae bacterium]